MNEMVLRAKEGFLKPRKVILRKYRMSLFRLQGFLEDTIIIITTTK